MVREEAAGAGRGAEGRLVGWMGRWAWVVLAGLLAVFFAQMVVLSASKVMWFDELFTRNLAVQPTWALFQSGWAIDGNPPLLGTVDWLLAKRFGAGVFVLRLPCLVGYMGAMALLFVFVRRRLGAMAGLLAAAMVGLNSFVNFYAVEARPYGLVLLFTALALVGWQAATDAERPRRWAVGLVAVALAGGVLSHHLALFSVGLPLFFGELARTVRRRRLDWVLLGAVLCGLLPLVYTVRLMRATSARLLIYSNYPRGLPHTWPSWDYKHFIERPYLVLMFLLVVAMLWPRLTGWRLRLRGRTEMLGWPVHEFAAVVGSCCSLLVVFYVMGLLNGWYAGFRYGIGTALGMTCLCVTVLARMNAAAQMVLVVLTVLPMTEHLPRHWPREQARSTVEPCLQAIPAGPVVLARGLLYAEAWQTADKGERERLFYLTDLSYARHELYDIPEVSMALQKPIFPMNLREYEEFLGQREKFYVVTQGLPVQEYLVDHLKKDGARFTPIEVEPCRAAGYTVQEVMPKGEGARL